jgi:ComF family protein
VALEYGAPVPAMVGRWKFRPDPVLSRSLAAVVEEGIARAPHLGRIDLVTCVPQPRAAWGRRGFSPALDLARVVARATRAPLGHPLRRTRRAPPQVGLTARERDRNVRRLFRVPPWRGRAIGGRSVVLVDDVLTTGSTVRACARALREAGAARVDLVALARAHHA